MRDQGAIFGNFHMLFVLDLTNFNCFNSNFTFNCWILIFKKYCHVVIIDRGRGGILVSSFIFFKNLI